MRGGAAGVFVCTDDSKEGKREQRQDDPPGPGRVASDCSWSPSAATFCQLLLERVGQQELEAKTLDASPDGYGKARTSSVCGQKRGAVATMWRVPLQVREEPIKSAAAPLLRAGFDHIIRATCSKRPGKFPAASGGNTCRTLEVLGPGSRTRCLVVRLAHSGAEGWLRIHRMSRASRASRCSCVSW